MNESINHYRMKHLFNYFSYRDIMINSRLFMKVGLRYTIMYNIGFVCLVVSGRSCLERGNLLVQLQTFWFNGPAFSACSMSCSHW